MPLDRFFSQLDGDYPGSSWTKLRAFQLILALVLCSEYWTKALYHWDDLGPRDGAALLLASALALTIIHGRWRRQAFAPLQP